MNLPAKEQWKTASGKEAAKHSNENVYILQPMIAVPAGNKTIGRR